MAAGLMAAGVTAAGVTAAGARIMVVAIVFVLDILANTSTDIFTNFNSAGRGSISSRGVGISLAGAASATAVSTSQAS